MKFQLSWVGAAAGSSGDMVFQHYHGRTYGHVKTNNYHYPDTPAQQVCQGKFYDVLWQYLPIYNAIRLRSANVNFNGLNAFNIWLSAIYRAAETYRFTPPRLNLKKFGTDIYDNVTIASTPAVVTWPYDYIRFATDLSYQSLIDFVPLFMPTIGINVTNQTLLLTMYGLGSSLPPYIQFTNTQDWHQGDELKVYAALISENFMSNFFLVAE